MTDPERQVGTPKSSERSDFVRCLGYAALAEIIIGMIGIGGLLDAPYVPTRTRAKQDAHELLMSAVECFFAPADWTGRALDSGNSGLIYGGMRLVLALVAPTIVWGAGLFVLRFSSRRLEETVNQLEARSQPKHSSS